MLGAQWSRLDSWPSRRQLTGRRWLNPIAGCARPIELASGGNKVALINATGRPAGSPEHCPKRNQNGPHVAQISLHTPRLNRRRQAFAHYEEFAPNYYYRRAGRSQLHSIGSDRPGRSTFVGLASDPGLRVGADEG